MQVPPKESFFSRLLGAYLPPVWARSQASQTSSGSSASSDPQAWESDPRWGREHWRIRHEPIEWPKRERVAAVLSVTFGFPDFSFKLPEGGGTTGPVARIHVQLYGAKFGVWRLLDLLDRHNFKASFEVNGFAAAQFADVVKEISRRGHEIVAYNWADNVMHDQQTVDKDRELIRRTLSAIESVTGKRPTGWVAPGLRFGEKTLDLLATEGIQWHACNLSDDLPYVIHVGAKKMLVIPHAGRQMDDAGFIIGTRRSPEVYLDFLKREFRALYREGDKMSKMFNFSVHPEYGGRPFFIGAVEEMLAYLKSLPDVWLTTRQDIAEWWTRQNYS